jgi:hypothetical protein
MAGRVFISCGQRPPAEREVAERIRALLEDEFHLSAYLAFRIQSLDDVMTITRELKSSDYFLFIDFLRRPERSEDLPVSLFTHQELALAHHLGFKDIIALQQEGAPLEGFLRYVLSNPEHRFESATTGQTWLRLVPSAYSTPWIYQMVARNPPRIEAT